ncbi:MAG: phosphate acyltransferase PlsX [Pseudomonadota bacterium]
MTGEAVIAIDAMGGDAGPAAVVGGMARSARKNPDIRFIVHGDAETLRPLVARRAGLSERCEIRHAPESIAMDARPAQILRRAEATSMWGALETVRAGEASVVVSCGNTGALMALARLRLGKAPGVDRPAIAVLWPSRGPAGYNIVLDVGADIRADPRDLLQFAVLGAEYARAGLEATRPRVGLLNVGTEAHKGPPDLHEAANMIAARAEAADFRFLGFVEGDAIPSDAVDVIVTDGFTGNIALKTGEGTASLVRGFLKEAFDFSLLSRIGAIFAYTSLLRLRKRMDPRQVNGGVFLGLNGAVVKSHGGADALAVSSAIKLAYRLAVGRFTDHVVERLETLPLDAETTGEVHSRGALEAE